MMSMSHHACAKSEPFRNGHKPERLKAGKGLKSAGRDATSTQDAMQKLAEG
jgi:hypothetical protein